MLNYVCFYSIFKFLPIYKKMRINEAFWLWLIPNKNDNLILKNFQSKINRIISGPKFDIHLTICGPFLKQPKISNEFLSQIKTQNIIIESVCFDNKYYESIYFKIKRNKILNNLRYKLCEKFKVQNIKFKPHISLYYGIQPLKIKKKITKDIVVKKYPIKVNKLALVYVNEKKEIWKILKKWKLKSD